MEKDFKSENFDNLKTLTNKEHRLLVRKLKNNCFIKLKEFKF